LKQHGAAYFGPALLATAHYSLAVMNLIGSMYEKSQLLNFSFYGGNRGYCRRWFNLLIYEIPVGTMD
jgi:hypothetical protein